MGKYYLPYEKQKVWLDALLKDNFGNCKNHHEKFNEKNVFCLDCRMSFCRHGKESHSRHGRFQIYQYCYNDVVRYSDLVGHFDCSNIQTYKSNKDRVVHLHNLRPFSIENKLESQIKDTKTICEVCGKHLQEKRNKFCSIKCKMLSIEGVEVNTNDQNQSSEAESSISMVESYEYVDIVNYRKRPRKNSPMRSLSSFVYCN